MPEGDTIHRIAASLAPRLTGKTLERVTTQGLARAVAGRTVASVTAHGKHLVIELDDGAYLRAHLGMNGRFRAYGRAAGEAMLARLSPGRASLAIVTDDAVYLWIGAPTIEISHRRDPRHRAAVSTLGPDVLDAAFDARAAAARAAEHAERTIAEVLLDQRVVAGIGNIYKSEALFAARVDPRARVGQLEAATLEAIYAAAHRLMADSIGAAPRGDGLARHALAPPTGTPRPAHQVYSRTGRPCPRCGAPIACFSLGDPPRWTWACPRCQAVPPAR
ncbi:MAG TPA: DNA-formamidopyrimidine glycosylase family protein [Kofleriaceae bacterium]|nr:DNA-formamidopyrimidine glycosylase family protein [Kofleriaceae bacterium]